MIPFHSFPSDLITGYIKLYKVYRAKERGSRIL